MSTKWTEYNNSNNKWIWSSERFINWTQNMFFPCCHTCLSLIWTKLADILVQNRSSSYEYSKGSIGIAKRSLSCHQIRCKLILCVRSKFWYHNNILGESFLHKANYWKKNKKSKYLDLNWHTEKVRDNVRNACRVKKKC